MLKDLLIFGFDLPRHKGPGSLVLGGSRSPAGGSYAPWVSVDSTHDVMPQLLLVETQARSEGSICVKVVNLYTRVARVCWSKSLIRWSCTKGD